MAIPETTTTLIVMMVGGMFFLTVTITIMLLVMHKGNPTHSTSTSPSTSGATPPTRIPPAFELESRPPEPPRHSLDLTPSLPGDVAAQSPGHGYITVPLEQDEVVPPRGFVEKFFGGRRERRWQVPRAWEGEDDEENCAGGRNRTSRESLW